MRKLNPRWAGEGMAVQQTRVLDDRPGYSPDILVHPPGAAPVIIETKFDRQASLLEKQAGGRLGSSVGSEPVETVMMVLYPESWREAPEEQLDGDLSSDRPCLRWALLSESGRVPTAGWASSGLAQIADIIDICAVSVSRLTQAVGELEDGVREAGTLIYRSGRADSVVEVLRQHQDPTVSGIQSCRMAAMLLVNAFIFQNVLAGHGVANVRTVEAVRNERVALADGSEVLRPSVHAVRAAWKGILQINWWPIFDISTRIIEELAPNTASQILHRAAIAADRIVSTHIRNLQDAVGQMFGRLVADRDLLKAHYTRVEAARLLAEIAVERLDVDWSDRNAVTGLRVADFACGTGMLLTACYRSIAGRVRRAGVNARELHADMMQTVFTGMDVLPAAVHLTAMVLSSQHPDMVYGGTSIHLVPLGCDIRPDGRTTTNLGALDMLRDGANVPSLFGERSDLQVAGTARETRANTTVMVSPQSCDLVIMNPPYGRATKHSRRGVTHAGATTDLVPPFAAFGASPEDQRIMADRLAKLSRRVPERAAHGNAGLGSYFFDIAHAKLRPGGVLALVLPLTAAAGKDWGGLRDRLAAHYEGVTFIGLAGATDEERQFSADTGIAELLLVAKRRCTPRIEHTTLRDVHWVTLLRRPTSETEALIDARLVTGIEPSDSDGSPGELRFGYDLKGRVVTAGIDDGGLLAIYSDTVREASNGLMAGTLRLGRVPPIHIPITRLGNLGERGPYHLDTATHRELQGSRNLRAPFYIDPMPEHGATYFPLLWAHNAPSGRESRLEVLPDRAGTIREGQDGKARHLFRNYATTFHLNQDCDFGSQMLAACMTPEPVLGGRAWPGYRLTDSRHAAFLVLWMNTTLGLIAFWLTGTRQQKRRALITVTRQRLIPVYDPRELSERQVDEAEMLYTKLKTVRLLPANQADRDPARHELDTAVLCDLLRLHQQAETSRDDFMNALAVLRTAWCNEPHIARA